MVEAERILKGAPVLTQDPENPVAEAIAFRHGRILAVGSEAEVTQDQGPGTDVIELSSDQLVLPGFVDAHTHAARLGEMHWRQDLGTADTKDEAIQILEAIAERTPEDGWVIGWNWDESTWPTNEPLTRKDLDQASTTRKIMARRVCGHHAVLNTPGLEALDLDDAPGVQEKNGHPTGTLLEDAADAAWEACAPAFETCVKGLEAETKRLATLGITTVADTAGPRDVQLLTRGASDGFFQQRSHLYIRQRHLLHLDALNLGPIQSPGCSLTGVKTYTDGSIGARTAAVTETYEDADTKGTLLKDEQALTTITQRTHRLGLQPKLHAIGDRAITTVLDAIETANIPPTARPRIEHAEMLTPEHIQRMERLGVVCVMQPNFIKNWQTPNGLYEKALGTDRARTMNPLKRVHESNVPLAFGSDGMPYGPLYGIQAALEHPNKDQRLTPETAITAYTRTAAYALGRENELGMLRPGMLADAVVLTRDPRNAPIEDVNIQMTLKDGRPIHDAR